MMNLMSVTSNNSLEGYCKEQGIVKLALFDAKQDYLHMPGCNIGGVLEFSPEAQPDLISIAGNELEIAKILGIDAIYLRLADELNSSQRQDILDKAVIRYERK